MSFGSAPGGERSKIATLAGLRILLTRVQTILSIFHFADLGFSSARFAWLTPASFPRAAGLDRRVMAGCGASLPCCASGLFCQHCPRCCGMTFLSQARPVARERFADGLPREWLYPLR